MSVNDQSSLCLCPATCSRFNFIFPKFLTCIDCFFYFNDSLTACLTGLNASALFVACKIFLIYPVYYVTHIYTDKINWRDFLFLRDSLVYLSYSLLTPDSGMLPSEQQHNE